MAISIRQLPRRIDATLREPWQIRALAIVDATIVTIVILLAGRVITGSWPMATAGGDEREIGIVPVALVTVVAGLAAWGLLALLERTTARAATAWSIISVVVLLLSLLGPLGSGGDTASTVVLTLLHLGAGATIMPLMRRSVAA